MRVWPERRFWRRPHEFTWRPCMPCAGVGAHRALPRKPAPSHAPGAFIAPMRDSAVGNDSLPRKLRDGAAEAMNQCLCVQLGCGYCATVTDNRSSPTTTAVALAHCAANAPRAVTTHRASRMPPSASMLRRGQGHPMARALQRRAIIRPMVRKVTIGRDQL
jgi:hypothetical protein